MTDASARQTARGETAFLQTEGLTKRFGQFTALDHVDLSIERGEFHSVIGPNGAGKTTLFNLISGALQPTAGSIRLGTTDLTGLSPAERVSERLARSFQLTTVFNGLSVRENVRLAAQAEAFTEMSSVRRLLSKPSRFDDINDHTASVLEDLRLTDVAETQASNLSYGDRRRLEVGLVLATDPEVVLLDEPTAGMSSDETSETMALLDDVLTDRTVVLVEHNVDLVLRASDRITTLSNGEVIATGTPEEIASDPDVRDAYLGGYTQ
ncbi:MAG: ABC transporter ATP-binding protein [Halobellus sp.]|uniref:ABC transporter ATP-binding protein n=1 Tax=Halobellus sp. TaxID=1979212 RepID=UPI0035D43B46